MLSIGTAAQAATTAYTDFDAFQAATGDLTSHTRAAYGLTTSAVANSDGLTISQPSGASIASTSIFTSTTNGISDAMLIRGFEDLDFDFAAERFGFGLSLFEPTITNINGCNTSCVESSFIFSLYDGTTFVGS